MIDSLKKIASAKSWPILNELGIRLVCWKPENQSRPWLVFSCLTDLIENGWVTTYFPIGRILSNRLINGVFNNRQTRNVKQPWVEYIDPGSHLRYELLTKLDIISSFLYFLNKIGEPLIFSKLLVLNIMCSTFVIRLWLTLESLYERY